VPTRSRASSLTAVTARKRFGFLFLAIRIFRSRRPKRSVIEAEVADFVCVPEELVGVLEACEVEAA
jgi:hypothetical protein